MRKIQCEELRLEVIHPDAAGIDIGNESHCVAVPLSSDEVVRTYRAITQCQVPQVVAKQQAAAA